MPNSPLTGRDAGDVESFIVPDLQVRSPDEGDVRALAWLFSEMQRYYGFPVPQEKALEAAALACRPCVADFDPRVLLAVSGRAILGSIVLNVTFPAFELSRSLYVRDLYIAAAARRRGIGQILVRAAARLTLEGGFSALDWTTDAKNKAAHMMYESCGAQRVDRIYYRLTGPDLIRAAAASG